MTIRHLLTHTSGIKDDYWQLYRGSPLVNYDEKDIYAYATSQPFVSKPGEQYAYSNEGYYLLDVIIAKVTGEPYTKWITEHVLKVAGMRTARMYNPWEIVPHMVSSYALKDGRLVHNRADIMSDRGEAIAGWGLYASLDDMVAFDAALKSGRLISRKSLDAMWSNARLNNGYPSESGIGFNRVTYVRGHRAAYKGGQAGVAYTVYPDDDVSVIFLTNIEGSGWFDTYSANDVARFYDRGIQPPIGASATCRPRSGAHGAIAPVAKRYRHRHLTLPAAHSANERGNDAGDSRTGQTTSRRHVGIAVSRLRKGEPQRSVWRRAILLLSHAGSARPAGSRIRTRAQWSARFRRRSVGVTRLLF